MSQVCTVIQADPWNLRDSLISLASTNEVQIVTKTYSAGKFIVVSEDAAPAGQTVVVIAGDPETVRDEINVLAASFTIDLVAQTFSASHYVVVYR